MRKIPTIALASALLMAGPAKAMDGNQLLQQCTPRQGVDEMILRGYCISYIRGAVDMIVSYQVNKVTRKAICIPANVPVGQIEDTVIKSLQAHPEDRHEPAAGHILAAMVEAFPCPK